MICVLIFLRADFLARTGRVGSASYHTGKCGSHAAAEAMRCHTAELCGNAGGETDRVKNGFVSPSAEDSGAPRSKRGAGFVPPVSWG